MSAASRIQGIKFHVPDLDDSYPRLIVHFEDIQSRILNGDDEPLVINLLKQGALLSIKTFRREEEAMELCRDPNVLLHKAAHAKFLKSVQDFVKLVETQGNSVPLALDCRVQLVDWLVDHHRLMNASLGRVVLDMVERSRKHHESSHGVSSVV